MTNSIETAFGWVATSASALEGNEDVPVAVCEEWTPTRTKGFVPVPSWGALGVPKTDTERDYDEVLDKLRAALPEEQTGIIGDLETIVGGLRCASYDFGFAVGAGELYDTLPGDDRDALERERRAMQFGITQQIASTRSALEFFGDVRPSHPELAQEHAELLQELEAAARVLSASLL